MDATWVENLNTALDDTKTLCLANGERINLPGNMRLIFEVDSLSRVINSLKRFWCSSSLNNIFDCFMCLLFLVENVGALSLKSYILSTVFADKFLQKKSFC